MSGPNRPPGAGAPRQPWKPEQAPKGVTCPACGLANEAGARTCRNCGLPIASADDPVRGVAPGRVDMPSVQRSGLSATVGLVLVIGLLLAGGTLAVSGGGLLGSGGRFGADEVESPSPSPVLVADPVTGELVEPETEEQEDLLQARGTSFEYTCENDAIKDLSRGRWNLSEVQAGVRTDADGNQYDQVYWRLTRVGKKKQPKATKVTMEWTTPREAQKRFGIPRVLGDRAIVITFSGPVDISANQTLDTFQFENEGIDQVKKVQLFEKKGRVRTVIGMKGESCARMSGIGWGKKSSKKNSRVELDIERF